MYVFDGHYEYYTDGVGWITYTSDSIVYDSITLTPSYYRAPQVTFNLNGGNIDGDTSDVTVCTNYFALQWCPIYPVREGYTLIGWTLTPDGDDFVDKTDNDITVYAKWRDPLKLFELGDIIGDFAGDGLPLTYQGEGIYTAEFTYSADMNVWGSEPGFIKFKLRPTAGDWVTSYGLNPSISAPVINSGKETLLSIEGGEDTNITVSGCEEGVTYRVTVRCTEDGNVYLKISTVE
jgi:uncharacterized repeat protein (TIGR02543 family)